ncbi:MAG TPA: hypothetical protein VM889_07950 [Candidatus Thermoplasmatota archaeon]|nr:hypothetical protein [Candidatus Thermoplasmatota archaeon]
MALDTPSRRPAFDADAVRRSARARAEAILSAQLAGGERIVRERWAADLLARMEAIGRHVSRDDLVRRFYGRTEAHADRLLGEARYLEFAREGASPGKR